MQLRDVWIKKWEFDYINDLNLSNIEWLNLDVLQLISFYTENYLDKKVWQYVSDSSVGSAIQSPIGMSYLSFDNNNPEYNFLLGIVKNNCDKKTIVCAMVYLDNYYVYKDQSTPVTYIISAETNKYFRNKGLYKKLCKKSISFFNPEQHILTSKESEMGKECSSFKVLKDTLISNGFEKTIWIDDTSNHANPDFRKTICAKQKKLKI